MADEPGVEHTGVCVCIYSIWKAICRQDIVWSNDALCLVIRDSSN